MKTGIVLEGGAFRTVFSCGVMDSFLENKILPDYIIGVSAGAATGVSYAAGQQGRDIKIIKTYSNDKRYMSLRNFLIPGNKSFYGIDFAYNKIPNELVPFDYDSFHKYQGEFKVVVTNVLTGKPEYLPFTASDRHFKELQATCALPVLFPFIYINNVPYMDGGLSDSIPFEKAFQDGCDRLVVILTRQPGYRKVTGSSTRRIAHIYKKYPGLANALLTRAQNYNASLDRLKVLEDEGKVIVLRPAHTDGFHRAEKNLEKIQALYDDGFKQGNAYSDRIKSYFSAES